ncbi:Potassium channel and Ion transport domain containing protein [Aphelenchoides bicaudatus]|nr:Potassium channel and Ion transport domain containing protein [Aphelenchoides bicaudatus]
MVKVRPTGEALVCQRADIVDSNGQADKIITINIAGERFQTLDSTLKRFPNSLLGSEKKREKYFNKTRQEYFFDRHRQSFGAILYIYQSQGHVLRPENVPIFHFLNELKFYEFGPEVMSSFWENEGYQESPEQPVPKNKIQRHIWNLFESPESSIVARFIGFFSIFMITLSCIAFILETLPDFEDVNKSKLYSSPFYIIELVCSVWFLIEFTLRFLSSPSKLIFLKSFGNIMDFVAILPFYISFFWTLLSDGQSDASFGVLRIVRLIRVIQVFKLSRHSIGLRVLGQTLKASLQEIILMGFFLLIALILFSSGMYFSETDTDSKFTSIPASFWFTLATITTVGFGDLVPVTPFGKNYRVFVCAPRRLDIDFSW